MYFNESNQFFHGIMFHHFHDNAIHTKGQGSISTDDFYRIINFIGKKNILDANIFFEKYKNNSLKKNEVCITFDDALKCQIDIALPVLEELQIKAFFFVNTSIFENNPDFLEVIRHFRTNYFKSIDDFYSKFYQYINKDLNSFFKHNEKEIIYMKSQFPFYSIEDIKFRLVRDNFINKNLYNNIIIKMMNEKQFTPEDVFSILFFSKNDLRNLNHLGHTIGLHSHNHPTSLEKLEYEDQRNEYEKCLSVISKILNTKKNTIKTMSHPCGSYNDKTLKILKELNIELGFKQIMKTDKRVKKINNSRFEIAREDHSNILRRISK